MPSWGVRSPWYLVLLCWVVWICVELFLGYYVVSGGVRWCLAVSVCIRWCMVVSVCFRWCMVVYFFVLSGCECWFWMALGDVQWYWAVSTGVWSLVSPPQNEANFFSDKCSRKCTCHGIGYEALFPPITRYMEVSTKLGILAHSFTKYPSCYRSHLFMLIHFYNQQNKLLLTFVWVLLISSCCGCIETKKKFPDLILDLIMIFYFTYV